MGNSPTQKPQINHEPRDNDENIAMS